MIRNKKPSNKREKKLFVINVWLLPKLFPKLRLANSSNWSLLFYANIACAAAAAAAVAAAAAATAAAAAAATTTTTTTTTNTTY
jgi:hypothetical protein